MIGNKSLIWTGVSPVVIIFITGCASPSAPAPEQTPATATIVDTIPPTIVQATTVPVNIIIIPKPTETIIEKEILHDTGILHDKTYNTFDFKDMGLKFIYPWDRPSSLSISKKSVHLCNDIYNFLNPPKALSH